MGVAAFAEAILTGIIFGVPAIAGVALGLHLGPILGDELYEFRKNGFKGKNKHACLRCVDCHGRGCINQYEIGKAQEERKKNPLLSFFYRV